MAARRSARKPTGTPAEDSASAGAAEGFTAEERAAMRERARELRGARGSGHGGESDARAVAAKIAEMTDRDRAIAERLHALILAATPDLAPRLWYGMPAYARNGRVVCFFQSAQKFRTRYATLGFSDSARLDDGTMWPTAFALTEFGEAEESHVRELLARAMR